MKIDLIERDGKYFVRKKWGIFTFWWNDGWDAGWELFRCAMDEYDATQVFERLQRDAEAKAQFAAAPEVVKKTINV